MGLLRDLLLYRFYDTPEDQDCFKKAFYVGRFALLGGTIVAINEVVANRHLIPSQTWTGYGLRFITSSVPFAVGGAAFGSILCLSASVRGKNDKWNYVFGAVAAGTVVGQRLKSFTFGCLASALLTIWAVSKKVSREHGDWNPWTVKEGMSDGMKFHTLRSTLRYSDIDLSYSQYYEPRHAHYYFPSTIDPIAKYPTLQEEIPYVR